MFLFRPSSIAPPQPDAPYIEEPLPAAIIDAANTSPVLSCDIVLNAKEDVMFDIERRRENRDAPNVWIIGRSRQPDVVPVGSQIVLVHGEPIPDSIAADSLLALLDSLMAQWPCRLTCVLPPAKIGTLVKRSRSGRDKWRTRLVEVRGGLLTYAEQQDTSRGLVKKGEMDIQRLMLTYVSMNAHPFCLSLKKPSTEDTLLLSMASEQERQEWALCLYAGVQLATRGLSVPHAQQLKLTSANIVRETPEEWLGSRFRTSVSFGLQ
jgi:hypothetical protein